MSDMNCLNNENELISELVVESQIESGLGAVVEVSKVYNGSESDEIIIEVNNNKNIITATLKKMWFSSFEEFPETGSEKLIYADKSTGILYTYNKETSEYDKLIAEPDLRSISINGVKVEPDDNKNADIPMATKDKLGVVMVDESVSDNSTNPVQNMAVKEYVDEGDNAIYDEINGLSGEIGATNQEVASVKEELAKTNTTVSSLEKSSQDTINQLAEVEERISTNEGDIQNINTELGNKANKSDVPTKLSQLTNDKSFIDNTVNNLINYYNKTETYTKDQVNSLISQIPKFNVQVVSSLPTTDISTTTIYLLATEDSEQNNYYEEYIYVNTQWELLGTTKVDLSDYATIASLNAVDSKVTALENNKVDKVTGKDLSTNDFTDDYKLQVESNKNQISALSTNKQDKLTAGNNIVIENNVISSTASGSGIDVVQETGESTESVMSQKAVTDELNNKLQKSEFGIYVGSNDACSDSEGNFGQCSNIYNSDGTFYTSRQFLFDKEDFTQSGDDSAKTYSISENIARTDDLNNYVPKKTATEGVVKAYVINGSNGEDVCLVSMTGEAGAIARYSTSGQFNVTKDPENANSVTRKVWVETQLSTKVDKEDGKGLSTNDYTTEEKTKLEGIEEGATKTTVDSALSSTSTNPVQNKVVNEALEKKANESELTNYLPLTGGTLSGILYTKASTPLFIGYNGKVGMRAIVEGSDTHKGQINISNAWYDASHYGAQMSARNEETGKYNAIRVSHNGPQYIDENDTECNLATETYVNNKIPTDYVNTNTDQTIGGNKTFNGNVTIGGNLNVTGTTTTVSSTTLQVKDKLIEVANGNTTALTTPAGLVAPKYDGTNDGALVFDSTGTAYVGDVKLNDNGDIDVNNSDLQPLATRGTLTNGNLTQWNDTKKTLEDSGTSVSVLTTSINEKQSQLSTTQLSAVNSGITSSKVSTYDGYASLISGKQDNLTAGSNITITNNTISATVPTVNNGTLTITQNGTTKGTFTANQSGDVTIALTDNNTTYDVATTTANGLMSSIDKSKLDGLPSSITKSIVGLDNVDNVKQYSASNPNFSTTAPVMDGTATVGTATTYARSDHKHPTDTSRASASDLSTTNTNVSNLTTRVSTAETNITNLQNTKADTSAIPTKTSALTNDSGFIDSSKVSLDNWTLSTDGSGNLLFNYNSTTKMRLNTSGQLDVLTINLVDSF